MLTHDSMTPRLFLLLGITMLGVSVSGEVFEYGSEGFSVTAPDGWKVIPSEVIADYGATLSKLSGGKLNETYQHGFQRAYNGQWLTYPYILVQVKETGRVPEGQLASMKQLRKGAETGFTKAASALEDVMSNAKLGETLYDPTNKCIWVQFAGAVAEAGNFRGVTCGYLTEKGLILFHAYAKEPEFETLLPVFRQVFASVKIKDELRYVSRPGDSLGIDFVRVGRSALVGGLIGALVGLGLWIKKKLETRKTPPPLPPLNHP